MVPKTGISAILVDLDKRGHIRVFVPRPTYMFRAISIMTGLTKVLFAQIDPTQPTAYKFYYFYFIIYLFYSKVCILHIITF